MVAAIVNAARRSFSDSCTWRKFLSIVLIMASYAYENAYYPQITRILQRGASIGRSEFCLLCAASVSSVSPWLFNVAKKKPQRHRGHRGCTEKNLLRGFRAGFDCRASGESSRA